MREVRFGNWKLVPMDDLNWELSHYRMNTKGKNEGKPTWHRIGMYYQHGTVANAFRYAADYEIKHGDGDLSLNEAIAEYERITDGFLTDVRKLLSDA